MAMTAQPETNTSDFNDISKAYQNGIEDISTFVALVLPFPNARQGESSKDLFNRITAEQATNATLIAQVASSFAKKPKTPDDPKMLGDHTFRIIMQNQSIAGPAKQALLSRGLGRSMALGWYINACDDAWKELQAKSASGAIDPLMQKQLTLLRAVLMETAGQGHATKLFTDDNGDIKMYAPEGLHNLSAYPGVTGRHPGPDAALK